MVSSDLPQTNGVNGNPATTPRRLLLLSIPRTASNLLLKIVNIPKQPNLLTSPKGGYFFYPAFIEAALSGDPMRPSSQWTEEECKNTRESFQRCLESLESYSAQAAADNQMMFSKEHAYWMFSPAAFKKRQTGEHDEAFFNSFRVKTPEKYGSTTTYCAANETIFPDEYLRTWQMAFIIRHPALAWPSMYRSMRKIAESGMLDEDAVKGASFTNMDMRWSRLMYDWCMAQPDAPIAPAIVDAHDLIHHPEVALEFCERTGLDTSVVQYEWKDNEPKKSLKWACHNPEAGEEEVKMHQNAAKVMLGTLENSTGIVKDKAPETIDIDVEALKWREEFGEEIGGLLEESVRNSMPDYEYLTARRITV